MQQLETLRLPSLMTTLTPRKVALQTCRKVLFYCKGLRMLQ